MSEQNLMQAQSLTISLQTLLDKRESVDIVLESIKKLPPKDRRYHADMIHAALHYLKKLKEALDELILGGLAIEGWEVAEGSTTRNWINDLDALKYLKEKAISNKIDVAKIYCPISIASAEKLFGTIDKSMIIYSINKPRVKQSKP